MSLDDAHEPVVVAVFAADDVGFVDFVHEYAARLNRLAMLLCGDPHAAEDLTQSALVKTYYRWARAVERDPFSYARAALLNSHRDILRRVLVRRRLAPLTADEAQRADLAAEVAQRHALFSALSRLPTRQRLIVVLRYWEDLSVAEVAKLTGVSTGTVKSAASKALQRLREDLGEDW